MRRDTKKQLAGAAGLISESNGKKKLRELEGAELDCAKIIGMVTIYGSLYIYKYC